MSKVNQLAWNLLHHQVSNSRASWAGWAGCAGLAGPAQILGSASIHFHLTELQVLIDNSLRNGRSPVGRDPWAGWAGWAGPAQTLNSAGLPSFSYRIAIYN